MKKISIFTASMGKGGSERVLSYLVHEMVQQGDEVSLHLLIDSNVAYSLPEQVSVNLLRKHKNKAMNLFYWIRSTRRVLKQVDVVISFAYKINIIVYFASFGLNKKLIFSERTHPKYDGRSRFGLQICNYVYKRIDKLVLQNKSIQQCFGQGVIDNSVIIPNPVDKIMDFEYQADSNQIIAVGRLVEVKNFAFLIEAFSYVIREEPELQLVIYGEGPLRNELEEIISVLGLSSNVSLPGVVDNIIIELSKASLFVQTSIYEGQSNALLEAMIHGIPPFVLYYDGLEEIIEDQVSGIISRADKTEIFAYQMLDLHKNNNKKHSINQHLSMQSGGSSVSSVFSLWKRLIG